jgi:site-specific DNA-methyltransferase (adenine-specific)
VPPQRKPTRTRSFGASRRESHDASDFYARRLYAGPDPEQRPQQKRGKRPATPFLPEGEWKDSILCCSSESMPVPDDSVALAFTSPPYNVGKDYEGDVTLEEYLAFLERVGSEVYRVLRDGGRYVINVANLGRKPYIPLHAHLHAVHARIGFLPMGEVIWQKAKGASGNCAWGSWKSAKSPRLRDIHEYLLVFAKGDYVRPDRGLSDLSGEEFMASTLSVWQIPPASARRIGHPAPFPEELAARVIRLFSYVGDVVLDPFAGSGTTCVAALKAGRHYLGFDIAEEYCTLARKRLASARAANQSGTSASPD